MTMSAPPKPPPPPPPPPPPKPSLAKATGFKVASGSREAAQKIGIYGPGGVGKSSLVESMTTCGYRPLILDCDDGTSELGVDRIGPKEGLLTWDDLRNAINDKSIWTNYDVVVIDSMTRAQDWCAADIMLKDNADSLETTRGGYGKGYRALYERMLLLISDLEAHIRDGRHVVLLMHDISPLTVNPSGDDYKTYMPNLYASDKVSVRHRVKECVDHLFFVGYDVAVTDKKAKGSGSRTIYYEERPAYWAKSRRANRFDGPIVYTKGSAELWQRLLGDK